MKHQLAIRIAALALALLAIAKWLDGGPRPGRGQQRRPANLPNLLELPKNDYRVLRPEPTRWETIKIGLGILFNSLTWAMGVNYG